MRIEMPRYHRVWNLLYILAFGTLLVGKAVWPEHNIVIVAAMILLSAGMLVFFAASVRKRKQQEGIEHKPGTYFRKSNTTS